MARIVGLALLVVVTWSAVARAQDAPKPIAVLGLRPAAPTFGGRTERHRLGEARRLLRVFDEALSEIAQRPLLDDTEVRKRLGADYPSRFLACRGEVACVARLAGKLDNVPLAVYADYTSAQRKAEFRVRVVDLASATVAREVELTIDDNDRDNRDVWRQQLEPLTTALVAPATAETPPPAPDDGVTQLPPLTTDEPAAGAPKETKEFVDNSALDAISRGIIWHGYLQSYAAVGVEGAFRKDFIAFQDRAQLEFDADINQVHIVGKPQLIHDALTDSFTFQFRELYAARDYKSFDISAGEHIVTWGVTDFWPITDIVNPRDYSMIRNWRPIDEKLAVPSLRSHLFVGRLTFDAIVVPVTQPGRYVLDQTKPFHLPLALPDGTLILQADQPAATLGNVNGGVRADVVIQAWKLSLYELVGRDVLPAVHADSTGFVIDNDRVLMTAMSLQGDLGGILLKAEAAYYRRLHDDCDGVAQCFYVRRVPTVRANLAFETHVMTGLDAHLQLIAQYTQAGDVPVLPPIAAMLAPGLPQQYSLEKLATLRLQGDYHHGDFRPMAFAVWDYDDQAWFANLDLEYHLADGFAIAPGAFLFDGYAKDPNKNKFTFIGSLASSSNVYVRVTGWF